MSWYVLFVRSGSESQVKINLQSLIDNNDFRCVVPKRKLSEKKCGQICCVERVIFPGYVFVETKMNYSMYYLLNENPLVHRMLNYRNRKDLNNKIQHSTNDIFDSEEYYFKQLPCNDIEQILEMLNNEEVIEYSKVNVVSSRVRVISGPLMGKEGIIKKIDKRKRRAKISISLFGSEVLIDLGIEVLRAENLSVTD